MKKPSKGARKRKKSRIIFLLSTLLASLLVAVLLIIYIKTNNDKVSYKASANQIASASGTFVTLLFSRSEMTAADNCIQNDNGIARLDTIVAPYLQTLGMSGTGSLETGKTQDSAPFCTHSNDSLGASWADATNLTQAYGWNFVSHTATYPSKMNKLTPYQQYDQTCGSAATIDAHNLPGGHGLIAYPGVQPTPVAMQTNYGANCFAWGRLYNNKLVTASSAATMSPYWQYTSAVLGGPCNNTSAACYTFTAQGSKRYRLPSSIIAQINALQSGQWYTLQAYILVTGTNPSYSQNKTQWDCTSSDPTLHWSNDVERYCYSDWQQIVRAIALNPNIMVTDPFTVGIAFGRPASYNFPRPTPLPTPTP